MELCFYPVSHNANTFPPWLDSSPILKLWCTIKSISVLLCASKWWIQKASAPEWIWALEGSQPRCESNYSGLICLKMAGDEKFEADSKAFWNLICASIIDSESSSSWMAEGFGFSFNLNFIWIEVFMLPWCGKFSTVFRNSPGRSIWILLCKFYNIMLAFQSPPPKQSKFQTLVPLDSIPEYS